MATLKHEKMKEANHRKKLEEAIDEILSSQKVVIEELHRLLAKMGKTPPVKKVVDTRRKPK